MHFSLFQCWDKDPGKRPKFSQLKEFLLRSVPVVCKVTAGQDADTASTSAPGHMLTLAKGQDVVVINAEPQNYWCLAQSQHDLTIGYLPRLLIIFYKF